MAGLRETFCEQVSQRLANIQAAASRTLLLGGEVVIWLDQQEGQASDMVACFAIVPVDRPCTGWRPEGLVHGFRPAGTGALFVIICQGGEERAGSEAGEPAAFAAQVSVVEVAAVGRAAG